MGELEKTLMRYDWTELLKSVAVYGLDPVQASQLDADSADHQPTFITQPSEAGGSGSGAVAVAAPGTPAAEARIRAAALPTNARALYANVQNNIVTVAKYPGFNPDATTPLPLPRTRTTGRGSMRAEAESGTCERK